MKTDKSDKKGAFRDVKKKIERRNMSTQLLVSVKDITTEIINLHSEIKGLFIGSLERAIRIGELLFQEKKAIPHGKFLSWIEKELPFKTRTAQNYMEVYKNREWANTQLLAYSDNHRELNSVYLMLKEGKKEEKELQSEKAREDLRQKGKDYIPGEEIKVIQGDFREITKQFPDNYFDHILTDPPYPGEYLPLWSDLGRIANRILKPSGFLIAYSGQFYLDKVMSMLSEHLEYYWLIVILHTLRTDIIQKNIGNYLRTILIFQKPPIQKQEKYITDLIPATPKQKELHSWQQTENGMNELLDKFTHIGDLILDPFAGSGTTLVSCRKNKRRCIGIEIEKRNVEIIKGRLVIVG